MIGGRCVLRMLACATGCLALAAYPFAAGQDAAPQADTPAASYGDGDRRSAGKDAPAAYRDRLIGGEQSREDDDSGATEVIDDRPGQRTLAITTQAQFASPAQGPSSVAGGVNIFGQFDTLNYGEVRIDAARAMGSGPYPGAAGIGNLLTVHHTGLALAERWQADSALGVIRTPADYFIGSGARFGVPPLTFEGVQTSVSSPDRQLFFSTGKLGRVGGSIVPEFSLTGGDFAAAGFNRR
jgi:hypothetical protein